MRVNWKVQTGFCSNDGNSPKIPLSSPVQILKVPMGVRWVSRILPATSWALHRISAASIMAAQALSSYQCNTQPSSSGYWWNYYWYSNYCWRKILSKVMALEIGGWKTLVGLLTSSLKARDGEESSFNMDLTTRATPSRDTSSFEAAMLLHPLCSGGFRTLALVSVTWQLRWLS